MNSVKTRLQHQVAALDRAIAQLQEVRDRLNWMAIHIGMPDGAGHVDACNLRIRDIDGVSVRLKNVLSNCGINTLGDLHECDIDRVLVRVRNCGKKTVGEAYALLKKYDL